MAYTITAVQEVVFGNVHLAVGQKQTVTTFTSEMVTAAQKGYITVTDTVMSVALSLTGFGSGISATALASYEPAVTTLVVGSIPNANINDLAIVTRLNLLESMVAGILNGTIIPTR